jgi:hypothetical protein
MEIKINGYKLSYCIKDKTIGNDIEMVGPTLGMNFRKNIIIAQNKAKSNQNILIIK